MLDKVGWKKTKRDCWEKRRKSGGCVCTCTRRVGVEQFEEPQETEKRWNDRSDGKMSEEDDANGLSEASGGVSAGGRTRRAAEGQEERVRVSSAIPDLAGGDASVYGVHVRRRCSGARDAQVVEPRSGEGVRWRRWWWFSGYGLG